VVLVLLLHVLSLSHVLLAGLLWQLLLRMVRKRHALGLR
jgi:hypothetical protein